MHERLKWDNELACPHCGNLIHIRPIKVGSIEKGNDNKN